MIKRLRCLVTGHRTYRERRPLAGVEVLHWVCDRCGHAWPMMRRTADEYRDVAQSRLRRPRATRDPKRGEMLVTLRLDSSAFDAEVARFDQWLKTTGVTTR